MRCLTRKHLVEDTGQAVDVAPGINHLSHRLLGTHVGRSAYRETSDRELGFVLRAESACDAEVGQERMPTGEENVLRLDVAVHDAVFVGMSQPVGHFAHDLERWFHIEPSFAQQSSAQISPSMNGMVNQSSPDASPESSTVRMWGC